MHLSTPGPDTFPKSLAVVKTYDRMQQAFPGNALPASVVVKAPNVRTAAVENAIANLGTRALASGTDRTPSPSHQPRRNRRQHHRPIKGTGSDAASNAAVAVLRDRIVPETVGALLTTAEAGVTGVTAEWNDSLDELQSKRCSWSASYWYSRSS